jgi:hypothetical protein
VDGAELVGGEGEGKTQICVVDQDGGGTPG